MPPIVYMMPKSKGSRHTRIWWRPALKLFPTSKKRGIPDSCPVLMDLVAAFQRLNEGDNKIKSVFESAIDGDNKIPRLLLILIKMCTRRICPNQYHAEWTGLGASLPSNLYDRRTRCICYCCKIKKRENRAKNGKRHNPDLYAYSDFTTSSSSSSLKQREHATASSFDDPVLQAVNFSRQAASFPDVTPYISVIPALDLVRTMMLFTALSDLKYT